VVLLPAVLALLVELVPLPRAFVQAALGCILTAYGYVLAKHVTNLLGFRHISRRPGEVSGQVSMAHPYALALSLYQCVAMTLPVALIAVFSASWFAYGGAVGMLLLVGVHYR
jgi:hypothetical protein